MRRRDWQERFAEFAKRRRDMPFIWGSNDCCTFAAAAVEAITGDNPMAEFAPYNSEAAAARLILRAGGLRELVTERLGEPVPPAFAAVGDLVLIENEGREMLAVCNGVNAIAPPEDGGYVALRMDTALAAWRI